MNAPGGAIRESLMLIPYKETKSQHCLHLLGFVVDAGRRFAAVARSRNLGEGSQANPVGTTMAIMERGSKGLCPLYTNDYIARKKVEFKLLAFKSLQRLCLLEYPYAVRGGKEDLLNNRDFDNRVDILPVF